jgi:hypothetical protein
MNRNKLIGALIGLLAAGIGVVLVVRGRTSDLGAWQIVLGVITGTVVVVSGWIVTRKWIVPMLFIIAILGFVGNYFLKDFLITDSSNHVVVGTILHLLLDVVVFMALVVALILHILGLRRWFKS